jgi:hypothetical protein
MRKPKAILIASAVLVSPLQVLVEERAVTESSATPG